MKTYDFKQVQLIFGGNLITGFSEGADVIMLEPMSDDFTLKVGADGETSRAKSNNNAFTLKIKLLQTSSSNDSLNAIRLADKLSNAGVKPLLLKDNNGNSLVAERQAFIGKGPAMGHGAEVGDREWLLILPNPEVNHGGNNE
jgi:hypothetical protein